MCPLFAPGGSPWTKERNAPCPRDHEACLWYGDGRCDGALAAIEQIAIADAGDTPLQIGPTRQKRAGHEQPRTYACDRAQECQWQLEAEDLCPPRLALRLGLDPRNCAY